MDHDTMLNKSIRGWIQKHKVFPWVSDRFIETACWEDYEDTICDMSQDALIMAGKTIQKYASPTELTYICENISSEAREKLGLEVPEKELEYTIPQGLTADVRELLQESITAGRCLRPTKKYSSGGEFVLDCSKVCHAWLKSGWHGCGSYEKKTEPARLAMFQAILDAQLPPLKHEVPELNEKEREHVEMLIPLPHKGGCSNTGGFPVCEHTCRPIIEKIFNTKRCIFNTPAVPGSPERAQIIKALKDVLFQQKPLLPPHKIVQFGQREFDGWTWWLRQAEGGHCCPHTRKSSTVRAECMKQCIVAFPRIEGKVGTFDYRKDCPCNRYSPEITRTVIEQCVALGPKFEKYNIWFTYHASVASDYWGRKCTVIGESSTSLRLRDSLSDKVFSTEKDPRRYTLTPPPPKKEEFKPYVAVRTIQHISHSSIKKGFAVAILGVSDNGLEIDSDDCGHQPKNLLTLTNSEEAYKMLREQLGKDDIVKKIKVVLERGLDEWKHHKENELARGYYQAYEHVWAILTQLESESK